MLSIGSQQEFGKRFSLTILLKDNKGLPNGKTKTLETDNAAELEEFWIRNNGIRNRKKRVKKATSHENAEDLSNNTVEKIKKKRKLEE